MWERWLVMLTGLMGCWQQGQEWPLGSLLGVCLGSGIRWSAIPWVRECKMVEGWGNKMMHVLLDMSCGRIANTWTYGSQLDTMEWLSNLVLYLSNAQNNKNQHFVCGYIVVFLWIQKLLIKACMSWLGCFVKWTHDGQGEVTPSLMTNEDSWT